MPLSHAQAMEVAKRFNPAPGRVLWFADDGYLLAGPEVVPAMVAARGEAYACRRVSAGHGVEVARVASPDAVAAVGPSFGVVW